MRLPELMTQIGDALATLDLPTRVYVGLPGEVKVPAAGVAALVPIPTGVDYDGAYARGMDTMEFTVLLLMPDPTEWRTVQRLSRLANGAGPRSVKMVLQGYEWTECDGVHVSRGTFDPVTVAGTDYLAVMFVVSVWGTGLEE